jgi:nitrate/nitrite-specific signal transduction histidine kinase
MNDINEFNKLNEELKKKYNELEEKFKSYTNNHRHKKICI